MTPTEPPKPFPYASDVPSNEVSERLLNERVEARRKAPVRRRVGAERIEIGRPFLHAVGEFAAALLDEAVEGEDVPAAGRVGRGSGGRFRFCSTARARAEARCGLGRRRGPGSGGGSGAGSGGGSGAGSGGRGSGVGGNVGSVTGGGIGGGSGGGGTGWRSRTASSAARRASSSSRCATPARRASRSALALLQLGSRPRIQRRGRRRKRRGVWRSRAIAASREARSAACFAISSSRALYAS